MITKIYQLFRAGLVCCCAAAALTACSPESFDGPDQNGLPTMTGVDINMTVDQSVNQATFTVANMPKQTYAVWKVNGEVFSTLDPMNWANAKAGTYDVELRLGNRNGFSQSSVSKTFTFENSQVDYTPYYTRIARTWRINHAEVGHMGCGEPGTDGSNWWCAQPEDKADWGVYDDRITFSADGDYLYDPGEGGTMYVNTGCTIFSEYNTNDGQDFMAVVDPQAASFAFNMEGEKMLLLLSPDTQFPYISSDDQYEYPEFTVLKLTNSEMVLLYEGDGITWRFMLTSKEDDAPVAFKGYKFESDGNMLRDATWDIFRYYAHGDGWEAYNAEDITYTNDGNKKFVVSLPNESNQRWQAQFQLQNLGGVSTEAGNNYDFSIKLKANQDLNSATVKLTDATDDTNFYFDEVIPLEAETEYLLVKSNMEGKDIASMHLVFDFGGCQAGTVVEITDMVLKDHDYDDGAGQPDEQGGGQGGGEGDAKFDWNYDAASNLWKAVDDGSMLDGFGYYFAAGDDWHSIDYTEVEQTGDLYELTLPADLGSNQWQGQFHIDTKLTASAEKKYNFYMIMESDQDLPQVTFKLTDAGDTNFFIEERNDVAGGEPFILKREGVTLKEGIDAEAIRLFFDFGGSPGGANVKISKIYFEEADGSGDGGSSTSPMAYDSAENFWKAIDDNSAFELGYYFASGDDWHSVDFTEATHSGDSYEITLPAENGNLQWQSQFHIDTKLTASAAKTYDFQFTIETDNDCPQVTMKLTDAGDTNWFVEERNDVIGGEALTFAWYNVILKEGADAEAIRFFLDFGGSPSGTNVKISQIIFREHQ